MSQADLVENNPWWLNKKAIDKDPRIVEWEASKFKWTPRLGDTFEWNLDLIYVLRGPRQVGKTTLMKLKIRDLLESGVEARRIFYWPCDLVEGPERLVRIITSYQDFSRKDTVAKDKGVGFKGWVLGPKPNDTKAGAPIDKTTRLYIVLDEISSVKDWQKGIKSLYDAGRLRNCTLVLTGSHSIDLRKATETLARRRGEVDKLKDHLPDKILLPTKFSEYADTRSEKIHNMIRSESNRPLLVLRLHLPGSLRRLREPGSPRCGPVERERDCAPTSRSETHGIVGNCCLSQWSTPRN